jgi:predicted nucleic acid-binding protein
MKIYLDVSCLNRPFDDQWQERIRMEAEAVTLVIQQCAAGEWRHVSSQMSVIEIAANPDREKQRRVRALLPVLSDIIDLDDAIYRRATVLENMGFRPADAVHMASAEAQHADVLLTCDDQFLRAAKRSSAKLGVRAENPVLWMQENTHAENP